ncbi:MAG: response regulator transcription factor [Anaerolineae bacterium]|nr:response regulator transcription factor [Anaerolineae bacterium]
MANILAVDDEAQVLRSIGRILEDAGHTVELASNGEQALELIKQQRPDLVVLDIVMPEIDGVEVCRRIRADPFLAKLPVIFLTAKGRPNDIAHGLDAGGDDYLTKPFEILELPARIRALLRRAPGGVLDPDAEYLEIRKLKLHASRFEVWVDGQLFQLTPIEHRLLHCLMIHAGQPVATDQLLMSVWEYPAGVGDPKLVQVHIANLRAKIEPNTSAPQYIRNVRGHGYIVDV